MDAFTLFARTTQTATLLFAIYTAILAIRRFPLTTHLRFRADHIYYAIVLIFLLSFGLVYLCVQSLQSPLQHEWWVLSIDRIMQLALFVGILNCACGCGSGEHHNDSFDRNFPS